MVAGDGTCSESQSSLSQYKHSIAVLCMHPMILLHMQLHSLAKNSTVLHERLAEY